ncbi:MAG TPA: ABC transporter ATP-binding protein, partial [Micavibrio sp.]
MKNPFKIAAPRLRSGPLPENFRQFMLYVYRKNPFLWLLFFLQDAIHYTRFSIVFILLGRMIDILAARNPADGIPPDVGVMLWVILFVLAFGESMHVW